jgi:hypothetical protein
MLSRLIVVSYAALLEFALWVGLAIAGIAGYNLAVPIMGDMGAVLTPLVAWKFVGALVFLAIAFLALAVFFGPILVLLDIRHTVRQIASGLDRNIDGRSFPLQERKEPSI